MLFKKRKKKKNRKKKEMDYEQYKTFDSLSNLMIFAFAMTVIGILIFQTMMFTGHWHNVDLSFNALKVAHDINQDMMDYFGFNFKNITYLQNFEFIGDRNTVTTWVKMSDTYIKSMDRLLEIHLSSLFLAFIFGFLISYFVFKKIIINDYLTEVKLKAKAFTKKKQQKI